MPHRKAAHYRFTTPLVLAGLALAGVAFAASTQNAGSPSSVAEAPVTVVAGASVDPLPIPSGAIVSLQSASAIPVPVPVQVSAKAMPGVNLSGGEFGTVPGRYGYDYAYPDTAAIDAYARLGFKMIRIPFRWERLQPALYGPLAPVDRAALKKAVDYATGKGLIVILDMHDYAARNVATVKQTIGTGSLSESALANAWVQIAGDYRENRNVWFGLMNEPGGITMADWWRTAQEVVVDLRGQRVTNRILVAGTYHTGAATWVTSGNAGYASAFTDPGKNVAFEVHQYLDSDSSGTHAACSIGSNRRIDAALAWAQQGGAKLFVGEMAAGADPACPAEYAAMLAKLNASPSVVGWTAWGAGKWWSPSYPFRLDPINGAITPHMSMLRQSGIS